ncbi:hypothetical protein TRVL_06200 [Trypanosoma vivax]|nr:hypothetical protein TRVL_06200 [Trypanosoma vivax]
MNIVLQQFPEQCNVLDAVQAFLRDTLLFSVNFIVSFSHFLILSSVRGRKIFFTSFNSHARSVDRCLLSSVPGAEEFSVIDNGVLLPVALCLEARMLLYSSKLWCGDIVLFSCSLELKEEELQSFIVLLKDRNIRFVASQRLLCDDLKESLFDLNIIPLERLSLEQSGVVESVTGAISFHSTNEFILWARTCATSPSNSDFIGTVTKILVENSNNIWMFGKHNVATVIVPVTDPCTTKKVIDTCERAVYFVARSTKHHVFQPLLFGVCVVFLAEYIHHRFLMCENKNIYLESFVRVIYSNLHNCAQRVENVVNKFGIMSLEEIRQAAIEAAKFGECKLGLRNYSCCDRLSPISGDKHISIIKYCIELLISVVDSVSLLGKLEGFI